MRKTFIYVASALLAASGLSSCTNLDETLYDQVASGNYYNTKEDVIRAVLRPFEHGYWSIQSRQVLNEETADQLITPTREDWWDDGGRWARLHRHKWLTTNGEAQSEYNGCFQGIMQANLVIEDLEKRSARQFGFSEAEFNNLKAQNRVLRAWFYLRLLDAFRNVPLAVSYYDTSKNSEGQVEPQKVYDFIETELKEAIPELSKKTSLGGNQNLEGEWTQAGAASLLVRLYLNSKTYIGRERFNDCEKVAQDILDGKYGVYKVADRWDAAFDWNNETCDEVIFAFPGAIGAEYSEGCNNLIRDNGAALITSATDFVKAMGWNEDLILEQAQQKGIERNCFPELSAEEDTIVKTLSKNNDLQINLLSTQANIPISQLSGLLFSLEMKGVIRTMAGGCYHLIV